MDIGIKISKLRKEKGLSQEELANALNVSRQTVSKWESNNGLPDAYNLVELSKLFNVTTDYLLRDEYDCDNDIPVIKAMLDQNYEKKARDIKHTLISTSVFMILGIGLTVICDLEIPSYFGLGSPLLFLISDVLIMLGLMQGYKVWILKSNDPNKESKLSITLALMAIGGTLTLIITYALNRFTYHEILFFMLFGVAIAALIGHNITIKKK